MADIYTALLIVAAFNNFFLLYLLVKRPTRTVVTVSFMLFLVAINIWGIPQIIINFFGLSSYLYTQIDRFSALGYVSIPVIFFIFSLGFTKKTTWFKNFGVVVYCLVPAILFLYFSWTTFLIDNHSSDAIVINQWGYNSSSGAYFGLFLAWLESLMIGSIFVLVHYFRSISNPIRRTQTMFLIVAVLIPLVFGSITDGILPIFNMHIFPAAVPLTTIMAVLIGYAIMRYELFDVEPETILSNLSDGVITVNTTGEILQINRSAEMLIGKDKDALIGRKFLTLIRTQTSREKQQIVASLKKGKKLVTSKSILKKIKKI